MKPSVVFFSVIHLARVKKEYSFYCKGKVSFAPETVLPNTSHIIFRAVGLRRGYHTIMILEQCGCFLSLIHR